jgi:hypothetical protein
LNKKLNKYLSSLGLVFLSVFMNAQTLSDGIFMSKKTICVGIMLSQDKFSDYWEGTKLRDNANMGDMTARAIGAMATYGITDRLNVMANAPYVSTAASAGVMAGMKGVQDLTLGLKFKVFKVKSVDFLISAGGFMPLSDYVAAYPLAIGSGSKGLFGRSILYYQHQKGWAVTAQTAYIARSNIKIDPTNYYTDRNIFSDEVRMDDIFQAGLRAGFYTFRKGLEATLEHSAVQGGYDIRRNDMMFPSNRQEATRLGLIAHYRIEPLNNLQLLGTANYTLAGRNVGKALSFGLGFTMNFSFVKKAASSEHPSALIH